MPTFFVSLSPLRRSITPNGQAGTQLPHPLQMLSCTTTVPNSVRIRAPVGQTSRHAAWLQCLHTSLDMSQREPSPPAASPEVPACSTKATCRQVEAPRLPVLS